MPAAAATLFGPVLDHPQPDLGQVEHLPDLHPSHRRAQ
jgi:hypothetical protein